MISSQELENFLDRHFALSMEELHISGTVISVVQNGEILLTKGYGFANREKQLEINPHQTLFRVGSISKLITATAVMQLVEKGKIDLFKPVNQYLKKFHLKSPYSQPVTIANLLTHTAGIDSPFIALETLDSSQIEPLGDFLASKMPPCVTPSGKIISYSNQGMGLAGYLVEEISGIPFEEYVKENIFQPLEMYQSRFFIAENEFSSLAIGYEYDEDKYESVPFSYIKIPPGGALITTAMDMNNFMIAHLNKGQFKNRHILQANTIEEMHRQQFTNHPHLPGFAYGFYEHFENGKRAILHEGVVRGFASLLFLLPEENLGFFLSANNDDLKLGNNFISQFLDYFYPVNGQSQITSSIEYKPSNIKHLKGYYGLTQNSVTTIQKITTLMKQIRVTEKNGLLCFPDFRVEDDSSQWLEIEPLLFQKVDQPDRRIAFKDNDKDNPLYLFTDWMAMATLQKLSWYETIPFNLTILISCILVFLFTCFSSFFSGIAYTSITKFLPLWVSSLNLFFLLGFFIASSQRELLSYKIPKPFIALLVIPILTTILTTIMSLIIVFNWFNGNFYYLSFIYDLCLIWSSWAFIWFLSFWNILGFKF